MYKLVDPSKKRPCIKTWITCRHTLYQVWSLYNKYFVPIKGWICSKLAAIEGKLFREKIDDKYNLLILVYDNDRTFTVNY